MKEIMDASSMKRSLVRMAHEIVEKNKGVEGLVLVGIKTRGEFLAERLKQMIDQFEECDIPCDSLDPGDRMLGKAGRAVDSQQLLSVIRQDLFVHLLHCASSFPSN